MKKRLFLIGYTLAAFAVGGLLGVGLSHAYVNRYSGKYVNVNTSPDDLNVRVAVLNVWPLKRLEIRSQSSTNCGLRVVD